MLRFLGPAAGWRGSLPNAGLLASPSQSPVKKKANLQRTPPVPSRARFSDGFQPFLPARPTSSSTSAALAPTPLGPAFRSRSRPWQDIRSLDSTRAGVEIQISSTWTRLSASPSSTVPLRPPTTSTCGNPAILVLQLKPSGNLADACRPVLQHPSLGETDPLGLNWPYSAAAEPPTLLAHVNDLFEDNIEAMNFATTVLNLQQSGEELGLVDTIRNLHPLVDVVFLAPPHSGTC